MRSETAAKVVCKSQIDSVESGIHVQSYLLIGYDAVSTCFSEHVVCQTIHLL